MDNSPPDTARRDESTRTALVVALERLTTLFWGPTSASCQEMLDGSFWQPFEALAPYLKTDPPDVVARIKQMCSAFQTSTQLYESLESEYVAAFVNRRGGIRASLYASSYHGDDITLMGEPARLMEKRFAAEGLQMAVGRNEPADHLAIQLEFCFFLLTREKSKAATQEAAQFVKEALLPWVPQFRAKLQTEDPLDFYALATALLTALLNLIAALE